MAHGLVRKARTATRTTSEQLDRSGARGTGEHSLLVSTAADDEANRDVREDGFGRTAGG